MSRFITTALSRQLVKNYLRNKRGRSLPADETYSVFFDKDTIVKLLENENVSGLRFYFAAYETNPEIPRNPEDSNKMTLVAVCTQKGKDGDMDMLDSPMAKPAYDPGTPVKSVEANEGSLCPPPFHQNNVYGLITSDM